VKENNGGEWAIILGFVKIPVNISVFPSLLSLLDLNFMFSAKLI
jgi:hypothetical protein